METPSQLTIKQAAATLGLSTRTLRRRIAEGALSATKQRRGQQDVTLLDGAELARWAEASGLQMAVPGQQVATPAADTEDRPGAEVTTGPEAGLVVAYRETIEAQAVTIATLQQQVTFLQEQVSLLTTRALPPVAEHRQGWWQRLTGKGNAAGRQS